jgi:hypothetical protein
MPALKPPHPHYSYPSPSKKRPKYYGTYLGKVGTFSSPSSADMGPKIGRPICYHDLLEAMINLIALFVHLEKSD